MQNRVNAIVDKEIPYKIAKNCRHYAMCKIDFLGSGVCASGLEKHFVSFYPQGRMILYEALVEKKITVTEKCVEIADRMLEYFDLEYAICGDGEGVMPGWALIAGNFLLKIFHSRQPVWRLLILLKKIERMLGITLVKRGIFELNYRLTEKKSQSTNGFSLVSRK